MSSHIDKKMIIYEDSVHINNTLDHSTTTSTKKCSSQVKKKKKAAAGGGKKLNKDNRKFLQSLGFKVI